MTHLRLEQLKLALAGIVTLAVLLPLAFAPGLNIQAQTPTPTPAPTPQCQGTPGQINSTMYFLSKPQDGPECSMRVQGGKVVIANSLTNPAMTCPDMSSWRLFSEIVSQEFWKGWAADEETWPATPLPLCGTPGADAKNCCDPGAKNNPGYDNKTYRAKLCPYFPGDHPDNPPESFGQPPSKAHTVSFARAAAQPVSGGDPGRDIRQSMAELVFRNKPLFNYVFRNNLYNQEGVVAVFNRNSGNISGTPGGLPYHVQNGSGDGKSNLVEIDFPVASIMIKSNWINADYAQKTLGMREDPQYPYIKMWIDSADTDNNGLVEGPGLYWLVAFHPSSKDTPNWLWATFEHVNNPGRCDYTGCNDSYGYTSPDQVAQGLAANYTTPKTACDNLPIPSFVFDTGKVYGGGTISASLKSVLQGLGIGTKDSSNPKMPARTDRAWLSYRLKGSQTNFTDSMGNVSRLGNSVTEAGFMNTSSCIACHARAGTTAAGTVPLALGVFINEVNETGYGQSYNGTPNPAWYHQSRQPPTLSVLPVDFVWGFLSANFIAPPATLRGAPNVQGRSTAGSIRSRIRQAETPQ